jgi:hypothetical protein
VMNTIVGSIRPDGPPRPQSVDDTYVHVIDRIDAVLEEERRQLPDSTVEALEALTTRKNHLALELMHLTRHTNVARPAPQVVQALTDLAGRLSLSAAHLERHLRAAREMLELLRSMRLKADGDGTYTQLIGRRAPKS